MRQFFKEPTLNQRINRTFILAVVFSVIPVGYFFLRATVLPVEVLRKSNQDQAFLDSTMGNWFSTTLGLAVGVPIGLWINRIQQDQQEKQQREYQESISRERRIKVLTLVKKELEVNRLILKDCISRQDDSPLTRNALGMKDTLWSAVSDSGEIQWINEPFILDEIASAYYFIRAFITLEKFYHDPNFNLAITILSESEPLDSYTGKRTVEVVKNMRPKALEQMNKTITAIEEFLTSLQPSLG